MTHGRRSISAIQNGSAIHIGSAFANGSAPAPSIRRILRDAAAWGAALTLALTISAAGRASAEPIAPWPSFRGPASDGVIPDNPNLPETWSATENVAWKTPIPGLGWSSPVVADGLVFVTSVVGPEGRPEPKKGLYFGGEQKEVPQIPHEWRVYAVSLGGESPGAVKWSKVVHHGIPSGTTHIKNTYASETPVTDGERVYAYFGNVGVFALDLKGNVVWEKRVEPTASRFGWGTAASPVLDGDRLYVVNDNDTHSYLLALDKNTGKEIWRVEREGQRTNWATPYVWKNDLRKEIVTSGTWGVVSYDEDGKPLWTLRGMSTIAIAMPYAKHGLLFVSSGYVGDEYRPIYAIKPGASGDITLPGYKETPPGRFSKDPDLRAQRTNDSIVWSHEQAGPYNPSTLVYGDNLYVLYDRGIFGAFEARTGKELFDKPKRIEKTANAFTASPWAYNGKIFCLSEDGDTYVIKAGSDYQLLGKNSLGEMCMSTPAVAGDTLIIRTEANLYAIKKTK